MGAKGLLTLLLGMSVAVASAVARKAARQSETTPSAQSSPQLQQGREVFVQFCAACHGERGDGKPASGLKLKPPAMDLTAFKLSDSLIRRALEEGVLGTGMAAWKSLPSEQLSAVAAYTATLGRNDELSPQARLASDRALQEAGRRVYVVHCARCHGEDGKGDGSDASLLKPVPPSFAELRPSYAAAARVIAGGVSGSAMPAWPLLTRAEVQAVTFYVRSFYRGTDRAQAPKAASHVARAAITEPAATSWEHSEWQKRSKPREQNFSSWLCGAGGRGRGGVGRRGRKDRRGPIGLSAQRLEHEGI